MKAVLLIADGMADRPVKELGWKTPLEVANRPSLNRLARTEFCGIMDILSPGVAPARAGKHRLSAKRAKPGVP